MRAQAWTAERVDLLKRLWAEGETAAVIAARLGGMSRSAILGKVFRLRLGAADAAATRGATRPSAGQPGLASDATPARRHRSSKQENEQRSRPAPAARPKSVLELTNETCRYVSCSGAPRKIARSATAGTPRIARRRRSFRKSSISMPLPSSRCGRWWRGLSFRARNSQPGPRSALPASWSSAGSWKRRSRPRWRGRCRIFIDCKR